MDKENTENGQLKDEEQLKDAISISKQNKAGAEKNIAEQLDVVNTLSLLKADMPTKLAAILAGSGAKENEITEKFGRETSTLVEEKRKFESTIEKYKEAWTKNKELKKILFFSLTKNLKLLILSIAEHYSAIKKLKKMPKDAAMELAQDSQEIFIPLIHKLGIKKIKSSAEDIVFSFLEPEKYDETLFQVKRKRQELEEEAKKTRKKIIQKAKEAKIHISVLYRSKGIHSTYRKVSSKQKKIDEINDILAIRIITDSVKECYEMLGIVHSLWTPVTEEFDDYIVKPKDNNYRSLHTTILTSEHKPIEIQIRTKEMDNEAELGQAAHWKYKGLEDRQVFERRINWLNEFLTWQNSNAQSQQQIKVNFFENKIYSFTPKGEIVELPEKATVLDFAYAVHSRLGDHCVRGKANGALVSIDHIIENFDVVEILTSQKQTPKVSWLGIVKTDKARSRIRQTLQLKPASRKEKITRKWHGIKTSDIRIRLAKCCMPLFGDEIIGFKTTKRKITVHRKDCDEIKKFASQKPFEVDWGDGKHSGFSTEIKVVAQERPGIIKDLFEEFSKKNHKIINASIKQTGGGTTSCTFEVNAKNKDEIEKIINALKKISGVRTATRS